MRVRKVVQDEGQVQFELLDDKDRPVPDAEDFLRYLSARGDSPNSVSAYAHDLLHFYRFINEHGAGLEDFTPAMSLAFLEYLRRTVSRNGQARRFSPTLVAEPARTADGRPTTRLSPATINRTISAVSSLYEYLIVSGRHRSGQNPVQKKQNPALARVSDKPRPFLEGVGGKVGPTARRAARARTVFRVPRPMPEDHIEALLASLKKLRDKTMVLLMLQGGLRPGEVLNLRLEDVQYGRRRVVVRYREDHPRGARTKSRVERVVDLHEPEALATLSAYVMRERPAEAESSFIFLVGGNGKRRLEPLSYAALAKMFARRCEALGIREPWVTPHALRHSHATRMWEGGMRELALQKRLGHASPDSIRVYTRVSDRQVAEEYRRALEEGARGEKERPNQ